jgi:hypothetical protein
MSRPAYRCNECLTQDRRCLPCAARRAAALKLRRAAKREEGICTECGRDALPGMSRCKLHRADNNRRSGLSHKVETDTPQEG